MVRGGKDTGRNIEAAAQRRALRGDFDAEVRCLQEQLSSLSAAPASFTTTTAPPLISIITPTCNSLASAIKAAAVTWAATHDAVVDVSCGLKTAVLWRPAAETALSAVWMAVLLRRSLQSTGETEVMLQKEEKKGPSTPAVSAAATDKPLLSSKGAAKAVGGATSASLFHILVTGGDTAAHFVAPWVAGVQKAQHALSASLNSSRGAEVVDSSSCSSSTSSSASALCQNGTQGAYRLQPLLLCYGCPDAQVSHLRASLPGLTHNSNEPSCKVKDIVALENEIDWTPNVVELRTEVPTTGLVLPAAADPIADEPSAVAAAVVVSCDACAGNAPDGVLRAAAAAGRLKPTPRRMKVASSFALLHHVSSTAPQNGRSIEVVAKDVFNRAILQPPFLRRFTHTTDLPSTAADASAFGAVSVAMSALSSPYSVPVTVPGWCSLSFMDDSHAAALLRCLVQHHWKEPHYMGHSLAAPSRRGPLPSQAHALLLREALRDATTGACSSVSRAAARKEEEKEEGDDQIVWRHVCGGFALPLTATAGRESPYLLPGLLVCDLAATMTAQQQRDLACFLSSPTDAEQKEAKECRRDELDSCVLQAVQRVRRCVAALTQRYDTPERGYGDAVGGNLLFLCRYPAELAATVQAALTEGG